MCAGTEKRVFRERFFFEGEAALFLKEGFARSS